jgi:hypothetical protein
MFYSVKRDHYRLAPDKEKAHGNDTAASLAWAKKERLVGAVVVRLIV